MERKRLIVKDADNGVVVYKGKWLRLDGYGTANEESEMNNAVAAVRCYEEDTKGENDIVSTWVIEQKIEMLW